MKDIFHALAPNFHHRDLQGDLNAAWEYLNPLR